MTSLEQWSELAESVIREASKRSDIVLADVRVERVEVLSIRLKDGAAEAVTSGVDRGASIRVFVEGGYGFAYVSRFTREDFMKAFEDAYSMAKAMASSSRRLEAKPYTLGDLEAKSVWPMKVNLRDVSIDVKLKDLVELDKLVAGLEKVKVKARDILYRERIESKLYVSTEGRRVFEERGLAYLAVIAVAREGDVLAEAIERVGSIKGYVLWEKKSPETIAKTIEKRLVNQLKGKTPKAGNFPVVMAPEVIGVFVHEAFGHLTEADLTLAGSIVKDKIGHKVASELVTIVDDPTLDDGFGTFRFDDEGVETRRATLVEKGILRELMVDRVYATIVGEKPTGNARAESYRVPPLIRMRNTVMLPGDYRVEELFEDIKFGYYLVSHAGGQANIDGGFQVGVQEAYEIVNGEIGEPVRNLSISGNTIETLLNIDAVAKDFELHHGMCGKFQYVYVSDGGPHVRISRVAVGGRE